MRIVTFASRVATALVLTATLAAATDSQIVAWTDLVDHSVQTFDDPYKDLTPEQLSDLVTLVGLRAKLDTRQVAEEERAEAIARVAEIETDFLNKLIDVDWLVSQRWVVAERRKKAAWSGNSAYDGQTITLFGYTIPAPPDADGTPTAYLVPERGMCSHMPPPPPNQMVQVRLPEDWVPTSIYEPTKVSGLMSIAPSEREVMVVDGPVPMRATFIMDVETFQTMDTDRTMMNGLTTGKE